MPLNLSLQSPRIYLGGGSAEEALDLLTQGVREKLVSVIVDANKSVGNLNGLDDAAVPPGTVGAGANYQYLGPDGTSTGTNWSGLNVLTGDYIVVNEESSAYVIRRPRSIPELSTPDMQSGTSEEYGLTSPAGVKASAEAFGTPDDSVTAAKIDGDDAATIRTKLDLASETDLTAEEATREAADDEEAATRSAADSALSGRLDSVEAANQAGLDPALEVKPRVTTAAQALPAASGEADESWIWINADLTLSGTNAPAVAVLAGGTLRKPSSGDTWDYYAPAGVAVVSAQVDALETDSENLLAGAANEFSEQNSGGYRQASQLYGVAAPATGTALNATVAYAVNIPSLVSGVLSDFSCFATVGGNLEILILSASGNTLTVKARGNVTISVGANSLTRSSGAIPYLPVEVGDIVGVYGNGTARVTYLAGSTSVRALPGQPVGSQDWGPPITSLLQFNFRVSAPKDFGGLSAGNSKLVVKARFDDGEPYLAGLTVWSATPSTLAANAAYVAEIAAPKTGLLDRFDCFAASTGNLDIVVISGSGGIFTERRRQTVAIASVGGSEFSLSAGTLAPMLVEAGDYIAVYPTGATGARLTFTTGTDSVRAIVADPTGTRAWGSAISSGLQYNFTVRSDDDRALQSGLPNMQVLQDDDHAAGLAANWAANGSWTVSGGELYSPTSTDWSDNHLIQHDFPNALKQLRGVAYVTARTDNPTFSLGFCDSDFIVASGARSSLATVDGSAGLLKWHKAGGFQPSATPAASGPPVVFSKALGFTISTGDVMRIEIERDGRRKWVRVTRVSDNATCYLEQSCDGIARYNDATGDMVDSLQFRVAIGRMSITRTRILGGPKNPKVVVVGDSNTNAFGVREWEGWAARLDVALGSGKVAISGRDGLKGGQALEYFASEVEPLDPPWVIWALGTNDQDAGIASFQADFAAFKAACDSAGINLAVVQIPPAAGLVYTTIRSYLAGISGIRLIRGDLALSDSGDGVTVDPSKFQADEAHFSEAGHYALMLRALFDLPELQES